MLLCLLQMSSILSNEDIILKKKFFIRLDVARNIFILLVVILEQIWKNRLVLFKSSTYNLFFQNSLLHRKYAELEDESRAKERDYLEQLSEAHTLSKKQKGDLRGLEVKIDGLEEDLAENKLKLSASEGRVTGLENEIVKVEGKQNRSWTIINVINNAAFTC